MPITYEIESKAGLVHTMCRGDVTFRDVVAHFRVLEALPSLPPRLDVLLDLREMTSLPETGQLKDVAVELGRLQERVAWGAWAIVANRDVLFGMSRMLQVFADEQFSASRVFRDVGEARSWLSAGPHEPV